MLDVEVIEDPVAARAALDPIRSRVLASLREPSSAAGLAARLKLPRQKVNYHLRELEKQGLARVAEKRRWGGLTERMLVATASSYVVSPRALGPLATDPERAQDRLSAGYLIALATRVVREVGDLVRRATREKKRIATLSIDTVIRFRSAAERAAFTHELTGAVAALVSRYHDEEAPGGRPHRVVVAGHPLPTETAEDSAADSRHRCFQGLRFKGSFRKEAFP